MRNLDVMTEHTGPFKTIIEVLKEILPETNIEFRADPATLKKSKTKNKKKSKKSDDETETETENENDNDEDDTENEEKIDVIADKSCMRIVTVDTTKTILINLRLEGKNFTKFKCKSKKEVLGISLTDLSKIMKTMDKDANLTLYVDEDEKNRLKIKIYNPESEKDNIFDLILMDLPVDKIDLPQISFDAVIQMNSTEFHKICREMGTFAKYVEIRCLKDSIIFKCKGDTINQELTYRINDKDDDSMDEKDAPRLSINLTEGLKKDHIIQGFYELKSITLFSKCAQFCPEIQIYMKNNYPLVIKYTIATLGRMFVFLTPINNDATENADFSDEEDLYSDEEIELK